MKCLFLSLACVFLVSGAILADSGEFGVKDAGGGLAGAALYQDAGSILMNPASAGLLRSNCFTAGYSRLAWGIGGSSIERGLGCYVFRQPELGGAGLSFTILNQDVSYYAKLGLTIAPELRLFDRELAFGITGVWYQTGYRPSHFEGHDIGLDPIFIETTHKNAFGLSAGVIGNIYERLWFGLAARDINEPNLALKDTVGYGKRPIELQAGVFYPVDRYFRPSVDFMWRNETINDKELIRVRVGAESHLPRGLKFRVGYDGTGLDFGLTLHSSALFGGFDIDYAFVYPLEKDLADVGAVSHHFGLSIWSVKKRPVKVDLAAEGVSPAGVFVPGVKGQIHGTLSNIGKARSDGFSVSLSYRDTSGLWRPVFPVKYLDGLPKDSTVTLTWDWKPKEAGVYTIRMVVDDDGRDTPKINSKLAERNEENNISETTVTVGISGNIEFVIGTRKGWVTRLEYLVEEKPLVPIVFFEPGDAELDSEEIELMRIYAERLGHNPDANLIIEGFFDPSDEVECTTGAELALRRAEAVKNALVSIMPESEKQIVLANEIYCAKPEYRIDPARARANPDLIAAENRRAEMRIEYPAAKTRFVEYSLAAGVTEVPTSVTFDDSTVAILKRNEDAIVLIQGGFGAGEDSTIALARAEALRSRLENYDPTILPGKIRIVPGWDGADVKATVSGEGILWAPTVSKPNVMGFQDLEPHFTEITLTSTGFDDIHVDSSRVNMVTPDGYLIRNVHRGPGLPPAKVRWDWLDEGGHLVVPDQIVRVQAEIFIGEKLVVFMSQGKKGRLFLRVKDIQRKIRKLLVVQFIFDETEPTSHFLESRLDGLAHDIVTQARAKMAPDVKLAGHTDAIGTEKHNQRLSERRAARELSVLRLYLIHHLGVKNSAELDAWLAKEGIVVDAAGYGDTKPYTLQGVSDDGLPVILGNNETPRGRTVNRRVTVEYGIDEDSPYRQK
ncbi:hypothetical protein DRQ36_09030 [bacterium]|nr:MAG: hypothetical protein DRQ36_09030 [bacterium]